LDERKLRMAAGAVWSEAGNTKHGLYRRHCAHCHGISGDGQGPTAMLLNPYPRDYRPGVFKFKGTAREARPSNDDLRRVLHNGVPGTAMPSFALLPPDEVEALIEYVKYLSMRGQMEKALERYVDDEALEKPMDPATDDALRTTIGEFMTEIAEGWKTAGEHIVTPEEGSIPKSERTPDEIAASVAKGRQLFYGAGQCFSCHGPTGLGDGQQSGFDDWTEPLRKFVEETKALPDKIKTTKEQIADSTGPDREIAQERLQEQVRELSERQALEAHFLAIRNAIPRDLREGMYRGGGRPIDIFWRVATGISGTPMPAAPNTLTQEEIWNIVDYVHSLPFEPASRPMEKPRNVLEVIR
jgi:mono/diheme cytochrome c family protein